MPKAPPFAIVFAKQVYQHLTAIEREQYSLIEDTIAQQLRHEPLTPTRNRKRLRRLTSFGATWELRCGPSNRFRVLYTVDAKSREVIILAIARKIGNDLFVGKEKFDL